MPHQCTTCGRTFDDGSKEMLSGCPDCGGNKFQFKPASPRPPASSEPASGESSTDETAASTSNDSGRSSPDAGERSSETARPETSPDSSRPTPSSDPSDATPATTESSPSSAGSSAPPSESTPASEPASSAPETTQEPSDDERDADVEHRDDEARPPAEDLAQASARTDMVSPDELADADAAARARRPPEEVDGRVIEPQSEERPGLDELREELNSQFESIKIVSPGQYELNLMELYDRQEYIISLQEDGRYVIEVPGSWGDRADDG